MTADNGIRKHAIDQARLLLVRFSEQLSAAARDSNPDAIHDLRVSIRRFSRCLRVFGQFFPAARKRVRRRMSRLMDDAAEVRNRDIALELLEQAGVPPRSAVVRTLMVERANAEKRLRSAIVRCSRSDVARKWRAQLEL